MANNTPMMNQYLDIKNKYRDSILLFRLGDFYETFFEDAKIVSNVLNIVLTNRNGNPMAGIPYHALDNYLKKMLEAGYKVAICDQMENPKEAKGIVKREVTRVITPGTIIEDNMLDDQSKWTLLLTNVGEEYIACIYDFSTGEVFLDTLRMSYTEMIDFIVSYGFVQILLDEKLKSFVSKIREINSDIYVEILDEWYFSSNYEENIKESYGINDISHLEFSDNEYKILNAVFKYLETTQFKKIKYFKIPKRFNNYGYMYLDSNTIYNLSIVPTKEQKGKTLYDVIKNTETNMGNRKLRECLLKPSVDKKEINKRFDQLECFIENEILMSGVIDLLKNIKDIDRIASRISLGKALPVDLVGLSSSLEVIPALKNILESREELKEYFYNLDLLQDLKNYIEKNIYEDSLGMPGKGKIIKKGISEELDEYRDLKTNVNSVLKEIEEKERKKTGLSSLKIGRNRVYGFFIEISKAQAQKAPESYIRKQTLTNTERFIIEDLKIIENKLLVAEEKINIIEKQIYEKIIKYISNYTKKIKILADVVAKIDVVISFARVSLENNYVRPVFIDNNEVKIVSGRHPVVEKFVEDYTENDFLLDKNSNFVVLTGPNMSGKSTYLRQIGLISILAQAGCFVPVKEAQIPIYDRVFTRIGARDDIVTGKSTFLVEMLEMSTILNNATEKSLILLDEVGRGTSTLDGISVAWSISEYIFQVIKAKAVFATHYTELTILSEMYDEVITKRVKVYKTEEGILFLHKIEDGISDNSYGIDVAKLAGFPVEIIERAKNVLTNISKKNDLESKLKRVRTVKKNKYKINENQIKMF